MPTEAIEVLRQLLQSKGYREPRYTDEGGTCTVSVQLCGGEQHELGSSILTGSSKACKKVSGMREAWAWVMRPRPYTIPIPTRNSKPLPAIRYPDPDPEPHPKLPRLTLHPSPPGG